MTDTKPQLGNYTATKIIKAGRVTEIHDQTLTVETVEEGRDLTVTPGEAFFQQYQPEVGGFFIEGDQGAPPSYASRDAFMGGHAPLVMRRHPAVKNVVGEELRLSLVPAHMFLAPFDEPSPLGATITDSVRILVSDQEGRIPLASQSAPDGQG